MALDAAGRQTAAPLAIPPTIHLLRLPAYSPELNPVEHLWAHLRENYPGNRTFSTLEAVVKQLCLGFQNLHCGPDLVRFMTRFERPNTLDLTLN